MLSAVSSGGTDDQVRGVRRRARCSAFTTWRSGRPSGEEVRLGAGRLEVSIICRPPIEVPVDLPARLQQPAGSRRRACARRSAAPATLSSGERRSPTSVSTTSYGEHHDRVEHDRHHADHASSPAGPTAAARPVVDLRRASRSRRRSAGRRTPSAAAARARRTGSSVASASLVSSRSRHALLQPGQRSRAATAVTTMPSSSGRSQSFMPPTGCRRRRRA